LTADDAANKQLLDAIRQWEFRPAHRGAAPVAVEILMIVPHRQEAD